jgi:arylsulfatase A-like enzyme
VNRRIAVAVVAVALVAAVVLAAWWASEPARTPLIPRPPVADVVPRRTNVVIVIGCTVRADQTTPYGGPVGVTPFLDELAHEGTRFADVIAQAPWTKAAITAILTSRHPMAIDMIHEGDGFDDRRVPDAVTLLSERFAAAGYRTIGGAANPNGNAVFGFGQGFDHYFQPTDLWREGTVKVDGSVLVDDALAEVAKSDRPFYVQLLMVDAHFPLSKGTSWRGFRWGAPSDRVAQYRGMLHDLDDRVRRLHDGLAALGHDERDTVFVVIGDHGEGLFLPHAAGKSHGWYLYPGNVRVPLIISGPGVARGHVVEGLTAQVDLEPTLLQLLGLPADPGTAGRDLSPQLALAGGRTPTERVFVDTWFRAASRAAVYTDARMCQRDFAKEASARREKRAAAKGGADDTPPFPDACFDWRTDPEASTPVDDPALFDAVLAWRQDRADERREFQASGGADSATIGDDVKSALQGLGYLE